MIISYQIGEHNLPGSNEMVHLTEQEIFHIFHTKYVTKAEYSWGLQNFLLIKAGFSYDPSKKIHTIDDQQINNVIDGKKEGTHISFTGGYIKYFNQYKNDLKHGYEAEFFKGGFAAFAEYSNGAIHGDYRKENIFGSKVAQGSYANGIKNGKWIENGGGGFYENGVKIGKWIDDYGNGNYENGVKEGKWIEFLQSHKTEDRYYKNGFDKPITRHASGYYKNGVKEGKWSGFDAIGPYEIIYKYGEKIIKNTKFTINHESGNLWAEGYYKNGLKDGTWICLHDNGNLYSEILYKEGRIFKEREILYENDRNKKGDITKEGNNRCCIWYSSGQRKRLINYKSDSRGYYVKNGLFIDYYKGNKIFEVNYKDDEEYGKRIYYDELGNIKTGEEYLAEEVRRQKLLNLENKKAKKEEQKKNDLEYPNFEDLHRDELPF